jgi:hypothetical protein
MNSIVHWTYRKIINNLLELLIIIATWIGWAILIHLNLELKDGLSSGVLWLAAWLVVYYSVETKRLRIISSKQVIIQEEIMMNEFLPIVAPIAGMIQNRMLRLELENAGRGLAKNLEIRLKAIPVIVGLSITGGNSITREFHEDGIAEISANPETENIDMELRYQDIYNRKFRTTKLSFYRDKPSPQNRFQLKEGGWRFEQRDKAKL